MSSRIRLVTIADAPRLAELQVQNRAFLAPWDPVRGDVYFTVAGQRMDVAAALERYQRGEAVPLVILDDDRAVVGRLTLSGIVRGPFQSCSLGYWVAEPSTGRGLATEAVQAAVTVVFGTLGLHRVEAGTLRHNARSQRVLVKAGFEQFGLAPRYLKIAGTWQDHVLFQRLSE